MNAPSARSCEFQPMYDSRSAAQVLGVCERSARHILLAAERLGILEPAGTIRNGKPGRPRKLWTITTPERTMS